MQRQNLFKKQPFYDGGNCWTHYHTEPARLQHIPFCCECLLEMGAVVSGDVGFANHWTRDFGAHEQINLPAAADEGSVMMNMKRNLYSIVTSRVYQQGKSEVV